MNVVMWLVGKEVAQFLRNRDTADALKDCIDEEAESAFRLHRSELQDVYHQQFLLEFADFVLKSSGCKDIKHW